MNPKAFPAIAEYEQDFLLPSLMNNQEGGSF